MDKKRLSNCEGEEGSHTIQVPLLNNGLQWKCKGVCAIVHDIAAIFMSQLDALFLLHEVLL